jgi:hypothetical protein
MPYPPLSMLLLQTHVYQPSRVTSLEEFTANLDEDEDENGITAASVRELPSKELQGLWDTCALSDPLCALLVLDTREADTYYDLSQAHLWR